MNKKIEKLTREQEAILPEYAKKGIEIGMQTGADFDEKLVFDLIDKHRVMRGLNKTVEFEVFDSPLAATEQVPGIMPSNALYGQHDISWLMNYAFFRVELGLTKETEQIVYLLELAKHVGWMWFGRTITIVTRRPVELHTIPTKVRRDGGEVRTLHVLHNPTDMAVKYRDGKGLYALYGTRLTNDFIWLVTEHGKYDIKDILKIKNVEMRTLGLRVLGPDALISVGKKVHSWTSSIGGDYILYEMDLGGRKRRYLKGSCPSKGAPFCEGVPPTTKTCQEALAWREVDVYNGAYCEPLVRT